MNNMVKLFSLVLCIGLFCACEDSPNASFVYGTVKMGSASSVFQGTLDESGDYDAYGYCKMKGQNISFTVGHAPAGQLDRVNLPAPLYISIAGVKGPAVKGVYDLQNAGGAIPVPKDLPALYTTFSQAVLVTEDDTWNVTPTATTNCAVELFAVPANGEVIFENNMNKSFDYYVRLECSGLAATGQNGNRLNSFSAELFFENCS